MFAFLVKWCILKFRFVHVQHVKLSVAPGFSFTINSINHNHEIVITFQLSEVFFPFVFQSFMSPVHPVYFLSSNSVQTSTTVLFSFYTSIDTSTCVKDVCTFLSSARENKIQSFSSSVNRDCLKIDNVSKIHGNLSNKWWKYLRCE